MKYRLLITIILTITTIFASSAYKRTRLNETDPEFFATAEAHRIGEQVLAYQRNTGGWPKNIDMVRYLTADELAKVLAQKGKKDDSTIDNLATTTQMAFLARLYAADGDERWAEAVRRGAEFLLSGQYPNGGWPQFWPAQRDYQVHITFNDDAMVRAMSTVRDLRDAAGPYAASGLVDEELRGRLDDSFRRGVECILRCQIVRDGEPTVWCQQHDHETYAPAKARAYELPSFVSLESASIIWLLMDIPEPDERIARSIKSAMKWMDAHKLEGKNCVRVDTRGDGTLDRQLVDDPASTVWARFYDLDEELPFVCDRDGVPRRQLEEIGYERRSSYGWYTDVPGALYERYARWLAEHPEFAE